ncbi:MAG: diguanylate cyclase [Solidesulfovibrio sp. DCME]|uniref:diguanylate cyclase n=1 Tax=Solidesulfovibrio sp. DCME TaxID=3447380 RepID=UPI003D12CF9A
MLAFSLVPLLPGERFSFVEKPAPLAATFVLLITVSTLWTLGLVVLVNQKLADALKTSKLFLESTLDGLSANIALVEESGGILLVNKAWRDFARANGIDPVRVSEGVNYLRVCGTETEYCAGDAFVFSEGVKSVLNGSKELFVMEYPCHSPSRQRWFMGRVTPFPGDGPKRVVVAHEEITERKLMEIALEKTNKKLEAITNEDGLTKIANRRHFDAVLENECARHARSGAVLSVLLLDIDYFKNFNDTYGHVQGDDCLRSVAQAMARCLKRPTDLAARYGGEEFACLLPETNLLGAVGVAENIRGTIQKLAIEHNKSQVAPVVTVSIGVVSLRCESQTKPDDILRQADALLYQAKEEGRNRVSFRGVPEDAYLGPGDSPVGAVKILWNNASSSGNARLDRQHGQLVDLANALLAGILSGDASFDLRESVVRLLRHVQTHFEDEEHIMREMGYPQAEEHAAEHGRLLQEGWALVRDDDVAGISAVGVLQHIVHGLVMQHMFSEDVKYYSWSRVVT